MFRPIFRHFRGMIILYLTAGIVCAALATASVVLFQKLVDALTHPSQAADMLPLLIGYGLVSLGSYLSYYLSNYPETKLKHGIYQFIRRWALEKVSTIAYPAYQDFGIGKLTQVAEHGSAAGRDMMMQFYLRVSGWLVPEAVMAIAVIGVYDLGIMIGALAGYVVVFIVTRLLLSKLRAIKEETLIREELMSKAYVRAFMEMVVFRVNRRFGAELSRAERMGNAITDSNTRILMVHELFFTAFAILVLIIKVGMIALSAPRIVNGSMSVGVLLALLTLIDRIYQPVAIFNVEFVDYKLNRVAWDRFASFLRQPDDPNLLGGDMPVVKRGEIGFDKVWFSYGNRQVLQDVSAVFPAGRVTAILGKSGAGKSTLVSLALGLIKPERGRVLLDGMPLSELDLNEVYEHIAYISQDAPVFDGTVRENLCFDGQGDESALWLALRQAYIEELVRAYEHGLDTEVGEHGVKLSGGEKQRLALARVFYRQPSILILDEPTSALDQATEREVIRSLRQALPNSTILVISHSDGAIDGVDGSVWLEAGHLSAAE